MRLLHPLYETPLILLRSVAFHSGELTSSVPTSHRVQLPIYRTATNKLCSCICHQRSLTTLLCRESRTDVLFSLLAFSWNKACNHIWLVVKISGSNAIKIFLMFIYIIYPDCHTTVPVLHTNDEQIEQALQHNNIFQQHRRSTNRMVNYTVKSTLLTNSH